MPGTNAEPFKFRDMWKGYADAHSLGVSVAGVRAGFLRT
jgi:hypothetical protein